MSMGLPIISCKSCSQDKDSLGDQKWFLSVSPGYRLGAWYKVYKDIKKMNKVKPQLMKEYIKNKFK